MRHHYALEKLGSAVQSMATDPADIKTRLWHAYLIFHTLSEKDFADEYKEDWNFINNKLKTEEPSYDQKGDVTTGRVQNTLSKLSENSCIAIAEKITFLETRLRHELNEQ